MERHFSTGVATIVALMAAHRLARMQSDEGCTLACAFKEEAARIDDALCQRPDASAWFSVTELWTSV